MSLPPPGPGYDWVTPPAPAGPPPRRRRVRPAVAGLLAGGLVLGVGIGVAVHTGSSGPNPPAAARLPGTGARRDGGFGGDGDGGAGRDGGRAGEVRVRGTLTAVGTASIGVRSASGTATYRVASSTEIVRNGTPVALAQLKVGDPVLVRVVAGGAAERIFAGTLPARPDR